MYVNECSDLAVNYLLNQDSGAKIYFDGEEVKCWNILVLEKMYKLNNNDRELIFNDCSAVNITLSIPGKDVSVIMRISDIVKECLLKSSSDFDNFSFSENIKLSFDFEFLNSSYFWDSKKVEISAYHKNMFEEGLSFIKNLDWCKSEDGKKCNEIFHLVFFGLNILSEKNCELIENVLVRVVTDLSQQGNFEKVRSIYVAAQKENNKDFCDFFLSVDQLIKRGNNLDVWDPKQELKEDRNNFRLFYNFILAKSEWLGIGKKEKVKKFLDLFFCTLNNKCANGFDHFEAYIFIILLNCAKRRVFKKVELLALESVIKFRYISSDVIKLIGLVKQFLGDYVPTENEVEIINRVPIFLLKRYVLLKDSDFEYLINGFKSFLDQSDLEGFIKLLENIRKIRCRAIVNGTGEMDCID